MRRFSRQPGMTLIEAVIYTCLLTILVTSLTAFIARTIRRVSETRITAQTLISARASVQALEYDIRHASGIYTPTSRFDQPLGQLSLATSISLPAGETATYVDYYLDSGHLFRKREGLPPEQITAPAVYIANLTFTYLHYNNLAPAVRMQLTAKPRSDAAAAVPVSLTTTTSLRDY